MLLFNQTHQLTVHNMVEVRLRLNDIALLNKSSHSYRMSLAIWDHTVLPDTEHKNTPHTARSNPSQTGRYLINLP